eukprot:TRINITY_DN44265_c0_g1_i1.p4 TRINITY_DN44265_c0_g1~~TRINITY_DN44265_c0_g1_i1.p4  ORF type:complete len:126 (+),score=34.91 TRINITY_DN44265_c0_g1_i1:145-522(+)
MPPQQACTVALLFTSVLGAAAWEPSLGSYRIPISCNAAAQASFDEGLLLCFNFNLAGARPYMAAAAKADPGCAMAQWGISYANEPFINHPIIEPPDPVSYTHLRAHETPEHLVCRLLLEKKKNKQ